MVWLSDPVLEETNNWLASQQAQSYQPSPEEYAMGGGILADGYSEPAYQAPAPTYDNSIDWTSGAASPVAAGYTPPQSPQWQYDSPAGGVYSSPDGGNYVGDTYYAPGQMPDLWAGMEFQQPVEYGPVNPYANEQNVAWQQAQDYGPINPYFQQDYGDPTELGYNPMRQDALAQIPQVSDYTRTYAEPVTMTADQWAQQQDSGNWWDSIPGVTGLQAIGQYGIDAASAFQDAIYGNGTTMQSGPSNVPLSNFENTASRFEPLGQAAETGIAGLGRGAAAEMSLNEALKLATEGSALEGKVHIEMLPDGLFEIVDALGSPVSIVTIPVAGESLLLSAAKNLGATIVGLGAQEATQRYGETDLPGSDIAANPWVQNAAGIAGGTAGYAATGPAIKGLSGLPGALRDLPENLAASINPPPSYDARMIRGAIDPETGMPFATSGIMGGADLPSIPKNLPDGRLNPEWVAANSLAKGETVVSDVGETLTVTRDYNPVSSARVNLKTEAGETVRLPRDRVQPLIPDAPAVEPAAIRPPASAAPVAAGEPPVGPPAPPTEQGSLFPVGGNRIGMGDSNASEAFGMGTTPGGRGPLQGGAAPTPGHEATPGFARDLPADRLGVETPAQRQAREAYLQYLNTEQNIRGQGTAAEEIRAGRVQQARQIATARRLTAQAGMGASEAANFVTDNLLSGGLRRTVGEVPPAAIEQLDHLQAIIDRAYADRQFEWLNATHALQESVESGALQPRQREILQAVLGDQMPEVQRVVAIVERAKAQATTMPLDLGPLTKPGQAPLIGEQGMNLPEPVPPGVAARNAEAAASRAATPVGQNVRAQQAYEELQAAELRARNVATRAAAAPDNAPLQIEARMARNEADAKRALYDRAKAGVVEREVGTGLATSGPEMRTTVDPGKGGDLVLRAQTPADADLGVVPVPGERRSVSLSRAADNSESFRQRAAATAEDALNFPRSVKTGFDLSGTLRQALPLGAAHPAEFGSAFVAQAKAIASESAAERILTEVHQAPLAGLRRKAGLFLASAEKGAGLSQREEAFLSRWAGKIPGLRAFERGYVVMLDKLRADVFDSIVERWMRQGKEFSDTDVKNLAEFINHATGRGTGEFLDKVGEKAALGLFSPRFVVSKPQLVADLFMRGGLVRAEVAKSLVAWLGGISTLASLAYLAGNETGVNPLAGDFGKTKLGRQSIDLSGGLAIDIRALSQVFKGQRVNGAGEMVDANRMDTITRFARGKLSPAASAAVDALTGRDYAGNDIEWRKMFGPGSGGAEAMNAFGNLFLQDVAKAAKVEFGEGVSGMSILKTASIAAAMLLGASVQTDDSPYTNRNEDIAKAYAGKTREWDNQPIRGWNDLTSEQQKLWDKEHGRIYSPNADTNARQHTSETIQAERLDAQNKAAEQFAKDSAAATTDSERIRAGMSLRDALSKAALVAGAHFDELYRNVPEYARNPIDTALGAYYDTFRQAKDAYGNVDFDKQQELEQKLRAGWTEQQRAKVDEAIADKTHSNPVIQALYDAQNKIAASGYWDAKSKTQFRLDNPAIDKLLRDYGYSEMTGQAVTAIHKYAAEQEVDDKILKEKGPAYADTWRAQLHARQDEQRVALDNIYGDMPDRPPETPEDALRQQYYQFLDTKVNPATGKIPNDAWEAVDNWVAQQGEAMQQAIDSREKRPVSPMVQEYRDAAKTIADTGYWDLKDDFAKRYARLTGLGEYDTYDALRTDLYESFRERTLRMANGDEERAKSLADLATNNVLAKLDKATADVLTEWRLNDPDLLRLLVRWGYYDPSKQATRVLFGLPAK